MKLTVIGISDIINYKEKSTQLPKQAVRIAGTHPTSKIHGLGADTYFIDLNLLGGVLPNLGDILSIDFDGNFVDTIEWVSHAQTATASAVPQSHNNYNAPKPEGKDNGNGNAAK